MSTSTVSLVDFGVGNLGSVRNMFRRIGVSTRDISEPGQLRGSGPVLLPGVGSFDHGMEALARGGWPDAIVEFTQSGKPLLGICLGMQMLLTSSEEGARKGLNLIPGTVLKFSSTPGLRVPHMGWNKATPAKGDSLFRGTHADSRFYFVHSYYAVPNCENDVLAITNYGLEFASAVSRENVYGTQFHPEKSHRFGMELLESFSEL